MYENGISVPQSDSRSAHWYRLAAEQGDRGSQFRLGEIYYLGTGIPKDWAEAVKWWRLAMQAEDEATARMLPTVAPVLQKTPADLQLEGQKRATLWRAEKAAR
jgi:TPR repeat protein